MSSPTSRYYSLPDPVPQPPETSLDRAIRTSDQAFRCWLEEGKPAQAFHALNAAGKLSYKRLPIVGGSGLPSGSFFIRTYGDQAVEITASQARKHPMFAFQAQ
jgi:hypothetical protein